MQLPFISLNFIYNGNTFPLLPSVSMGHSIVPCHLCLHFSLSNSTLILLTLHAQLTCAWQCMTFNLGTVSQGIHPATGISQHSQVRVDHDLTMAVLL